MEEILIPEPWTLNESRKSSDTASHDARGNALGGAGRWLIGQGDKNLEALG